MTGHERLNKARGAVDRAREISEIVKPNPADTAEFHRCLSIAQTQALVSIAESLTRLAEVHGGAMPPIPKTEPAPGYA